MTALALERFSRLHSALYVVLGWSAVLAVPELARRADLVVLAAVGGLLYTVGAILFALRRPRPVAVWFGYHEVWHALGVAAGAAIFAMNLGLIAAA
jgi:hemolysin III